MNLLISKCVTAVKVSNFTCHYLGNRSTLDIGVFLGYIGIVEHKENAPEVWSVPPVTPCICLFVLPEKISPPITGLIISFPHHVLYITDNYFFSLLQLPTGIGVLF